MRCPGCGAAELTHQVIGERDPVTADRCPACRGCWLDAKELERLETGAWSTVEDLRLSTAEALSDVICPRCGAQLVTVNPDDHAELAIDRCPSCHGLWLDAGELDRLHDVAVEHALEHDDLRRRPEGWSHLRWVSLRVASRWRQRGGA